MNRKDPSLFDAEAERINGTETPAVYLPEDIRTAEKKSQRVQLLMFPSVVERMKAAAAARGQSMNDLANEIIKEWLKENGTY